MENFHVSMYFLNAVLVILIVLLSECSLGLALVGKTAFTKKAL